ncbi:MAG: hypothetical protein UR91_C0032G0005 [Candidatus Nomurabacteria bacterium GW2011_GWC2_35_8]|uniref:Type II secretion system protein G n=1 Tax=Candidatus Nomurabacteria bacterium GW2011_GWC2_35_8 TaxID=1618752 RepID=A0A0G0G870_9BACT|nr:MAG: hypothetical protein UR91_C0032G0005 [Candidatus Nomurabacteria bacterium GW2011_GWC2_35_8]
MKKNNFKIIRAFTLIEILVVIGIIVVLVSLVSSSYSTTQKKARDARRKQELKQIQNALEQYYSACKYEYPLNINSPIRCTAVAPTVMIMPTVPADPKTTTPYPCNPSCTASAYTICATLEAETPASYCLKSQQ